MHRTLQLSRLGSLLAGVAFTAACGTSSTRTTVHDKSDGSGGSGGSSGKSGTGGSSASGGSGGVSGSGGTTGSGGKTGSGGSSGDAGQGATGGSAGLAGAAGAAADGGPGCDGGLAACGATCVDLQTSGEHCGKCDHDCLGGTCEVGVCQPVTIATGQHNGTNIAVDATHVYWGRGASSQTSASVSRIRIDTTGGVQILANDETGSGLAVANGQIYWMFSGAVRTCPAPDCSGGASNFASSTGTASGDVLVAQSANRIYFGEPSPYSTSTGALWFAPLLGGAPQEVAGSPTNPQEIVSDATNLYWINSSTYSNNNQNGDAKVVKMPIAGGSVVALADGMRGDMFNIAVTAGAVYFGGAPLIGTTLQGGVYKLPLPNGVGSADPPLFAPLNPHGLIADANHIYFTAGSAVHRCPHSGCATPPEVIAAGQVSPDAMTQDAVSIYWVTQGTLATPASAAVRRLAK